mmetsp:Transcript_7633/g.15930  ORF Transcript_7633/g.15930 Transcript_7633/m.15930 type:complete len:202 (+) Transcript_7633:636-1241(+)
MRDVSSMEEGDGGTCVLENLHDVLVSRRTGEGSNRSVELARTVEQLIQGAALDQLRDYGESGRLAMHRQQHQDVRVPDLIELLHFVVEFGEQILANVRVKDLLQRNLGRMPVGLVDNAETTLINHVSQLHLREIEMRQGADIAALLVALAEALGQLLHLLLQALAVALLLPQGVPSIGCLGIVSEAPAARRQRAAELVMRL